MNILKTLTLSAITVKFFYQKMLQGKGRASQKKVILARKKSKNQITAGLLNSQRLLFEAIEHKLPLYRNYYSHNIPQSICITEYHCDIISDF